MRIAWIERLRILGAFGVVLIHCVGVAFLTLPFGSASWVSVAVVDGLVRFSLPLFFIISGTLLLAYPPKEGDTAKRLGRVATLILFWSAVFLIFLSFRTSLVFGDLVNLFFKGEGYYHLWYLWALIPLYLLVPLIHKGLERYSLGVVLGGVIVLGSLGSSIESFAITYHVVIHPIFKGIIYMFYFVLGGILARYPLSKVGGGGFFVIGAGGVLIELLTSESINQALVAIRFSSPFVALMGIGAVTLFYHFGNKGLRGREKEIASLTLGIYLVHPLFVTLLSTNGRFDYPLISCCIIFILSSGMVYLLKKVKPLGRFIV